MADPVLFDPRVEELLREIAADPDSTLLRVPRPARLSVVLERRPLVGVATAGLTLAERELVRVHAGTCAQLFRECAVAVLHSSPQASANHLRHNSTAKPNRIESLDEWRLRTAAMQKDIEEALRAEPGWLAVMRCVSAADRSEALSIESLISAAARLEPTDQGRILLAQDLGSCGREVEARDLLGAVLSNRPSPANRAAALANNGWISSKRGDARAATCGYRAAAEMRPDFAPSVCGWLSTALDAADRDESYEAAAFATAVLPAAHPAVDEFVQLTLAQIGSGLVTTSDATRDLARKLADRFGGSAGAIAHVRFH